MSVVSKKYRMQKYAIRKLSGLIARWANSCRSVSSSLTKYAGLSKVSLIPFRRRSWVNSVKISIKSNLLLWLLYNRTRLKVLIIKIGSLRTSFPRRKSTFKIVRRRSTYAAQYTLTLGLKTSWLLRWEVLTKPTKVIQIQIQFGLLYTIMFQATRHSRDLTVSWRTSTARRTRLRSRTCLKIHHCRICHLSIPLRVKARTEISHDRGEEASLAKTFVLR